MILYPVRIDGSHEVSHCELNVGHDDAEPDSSLDAPRIAFAKSTATGTVVCVVRADGTHLRSSATEPCLLVAARMEDRVRARRRD